MCSEIDSRTRDNPEAAMVHANQMRNYLVSGPCQAKGDPWPWPIGHSDEERRVALARRDLGIDAKSLLYAGELPGFDSDAHRAFMRSLG